MEIELYEVENDAQIYCSLTVTSKEGRVSTSNCLYSPFDMLNS
jgi:hypothetical protein